MIETVNKLPTYVKVLGVVLIVFLVLMLSALTYMAIRVRTLESEQSAISDERYSKLDEVILKNEEATNRLSEGILELNEEIKVVSEGASELNNSYNQMIKRHEENENFTRSIVGDTSSILTELKRIGSEIDHDK